jgi:hypothetical protein
MSEKEEVAMTKMEKLIQQFELTLPDIQRIQSAAQGLWNDMGYDMLQATADEKKKDINAVTIPRSTVIELVLDASRIEDALAPRKGVDCLTPAGRKFLETHYKEPARTLMHLLMKDTFTYAHYGM